MARTEADLTHFMLASDYNPVHYSWTEKELEALGDCKATAEVIKKRLEDNGAKVEEMYAIEHKGEKKATKKFHNSTDEAKTHYHILVKFEDKQGATLKEIAKFIGVPPTVIEKPRKGPSYNNMLSYLIHIKDAPKIQYVPEDVVTLAGKNYTDCFNENKEKWERGRKIKAKQGGKTPDRLFQEAVAKMKSGELFFDDLAGVPEYRKLLFVSKYMRKLEIQGKTIKKVAEIDSRRLRGKIKNGEITTLDEITTSDEWKLAYMYNQGDIQCALRDQKYNTIIAKIKNKEITSLEEIAANEDWKSAYEHYLISLKSALGMLK